MAGAVARRRSYRHLTAVVVGLAALTWCGAVTALAQRAAATRRVATVPLLLAYPGFYHAQPVRVRGGLVRGDLLQLFTNEKSLILLNPNSVAVPGDSTAEAAEVTGTFFDVGRTEPSDGRLAGFDLRELSLRITRKEWPGFGELPVLIVDTVSTPAEDTASVRALALDPDRFADQTVTVIGRFRGRNLYGDMPAGPGKSQWDFVLQSADGALWVTGQRPRGRNFDLRLDSRVDTGRWLQVHGTLRTDGVRSWLEAETVSLAAAPEETPVEVVTLPTLPAPEVVFSAPVQGETDVERSTSVRIQFSRDMDPATFKGHVLVRYDVDGLTTAGPVPALEESYDDGRRTLELRFAEPLLPLRALRVELGAGILARDGGALLPWTLTFTVGS